MKIEIEAMIKVDREKVWEYWTSPEHITHWNFASDDWCCPSASNELQVGGRYCARMEAKDGSFGFDFIGIYDEIKNFELLAYSLEDGREVVTTFISEGANTKVHTIFDAETENPPEMQKNGWQSILNNFKNYVESI